MSDNPDRQTIKIPFIAGYVLGHTVFRKADESPCPEDGAERDGRYVAAKFCFLFSMVLDSESDGHK